MRWVVFASEQIHFCDNTIESCDNRHFVILFPIPIYHDIVIMSSDVIKEEGEACPTIK